ncbi:MAG: hypothetical protein M3R24_30695 [Chloroflexota bacterium]|nr:hypothetical protein [Chloroflexota bacterium]PLS78856.1 MAG: hypothetical protein CYG59_16260 [Chloroflexota bacterium]
MRLFRSIISDIREATFTLELQLVAGAGGFAVQPSTWSAATTWVIAPFHSDVTAYRCRRQFYLCQQ